MAQADYTLPPWAASPDRDAPVVRVMKFDADLDREAAEALVATGARRLAELDALEKRYGPDRPDGSVLRFTVQAGPIASIPLTYAALRAAGHWYLTGRGARTPQHSRWEQLCIWLERAGVERVEVASFPAAELPSSDEDSQR